MAKCSSALLCFLLVGAAMASKLPTEDLMSGEGGTDGCVYNMETSECNKNCEALLCINTPKSCSEICDPNVCLCAKGLRLGPNGDCLTAFECKSLLGSLLPAVG